jgi:hypothetical protein
VFYTVIFLTVFDMFNNNFVCYSHIRIPPELNAVLADMKNITRTAKWQVQCYSKNVETALCVSLEWQVVLTCWAFIMHCAWTEPHPQ